jgi:hypothetical protein
VKKRRHIKRKKATGFLDSLKVVLGAKAGKE